MIWNIGEIVEHSDCDSLNLIYWPVSISICIRLITIQRPTLQVLSLFGVPTLMLMEGGVFRNDRTEGAVGPFALIGTISGTSVGGTIIQVMLMDRNFFLMQ